jgi:hypothetical protein
MSDSKLIDAAYRLLEGSVPIPDKDSAYVTKANLAELREAADGWQPIPERTYGFGDKPRVRGVPTIELRKTGEPCPNCGCEDTFLIRVEIENPPPMLRMPEGHVAIGHYVGCVACAWASPMTCSAQAPIPA